MLLCTFVYKFSCGHPRYLSMGLPIAGRIRHMLFGLSSDTPYDSRFHTKCLKCKLLEIATQALGVSVPPWRSARLFGVAVYVCPEEMSM